MKLVETVAALRVDHSVVFEEIEMYHMLKPEIRRAGTVTPVVQAFGANDRLS